MVVLTYIFHTRHSGTDPLRPGPRAVQYVCEEGGKKKKRSKQRIEFSFFVHRLGFEYAYIIIEELAYFTEVLAHAGPTAGAVLLHLPMGMSSFHAVSRAAAEVVQAKDACS